MKRDWKTIGLVVAILLNVAYNQRVIMNALGLKWESLPK